MWWKLIICFLFYISDQRYICEGHTGEISCPNDKILELQYGSYGRSSPDLCHHNNPAAMTNTDCSSTVDILSIVEGVCQSQSNASSCTIVPTYILFQGDPCVGTYKYLTVEYQCNEPGWCTYFIHFNTDCVETTRDRIHYIKPR